jgi:ribosome maturation factor RimP
MTDQDLEQKLEQRIATLGFELVEIERAGSRARPVMRVRIDRPGSTPGHGVTLEDCTLVSRALESVLDAEEDISERYVLEVSSPGIERPLVRREDYQRFAGQEVAVRGHVPLAGRGRRLEGRLLGLVDAAGPDTVRIELESGEQIDIPRKDIARAHLLFRWQRGE